MSDLAKLKEAHDDYIARLKARGDKTLLYAVPCCGAEMETQVGPLTGQWDTLATCPHCGALYMKIIKATEVVAWILEEE